MMSVDGTDCAIQEPTPFSTSWYSHKLKGPGPRYEVGVNLKNGHIVWVHGPHPCGSNPDVVIFSKKLKSELMEGEFVLADGGYPDDSCTKIVPGPSAGQSQILRARHESCNGRLKVFGVLKNRFRHPITKHGLCFQAVANICQLAILDGNSLFAIDFEL